MAYIDITSLQTTMKPSFLWNVGKPALASFRRKDYHGDPSISLESAVRKTLQDKTGKSFKGPIRLLTHLRYFGYCFNPVSFYYCFNETDEKVEAIMAEVTNTPWQERHAYVIDKQSQSKNKLNFTASLKKQLHVSPFWGMDHDYEMLFSLPENSLNVHMKNYKNKENVFDVTLSLKRRPFTNRTLLTALLRFPLLTLIVVFRIHWQALRLYIRKVPFFTHPGKI